MEEGEEEGEEEGDPESCLFSFSLNYLPLKLAHTKIAVRNSAGSSLSTRSLNAFLLSGTDKIIHTFVQSDAALFAEVPTSDVFPEQALWDLLPSSATAFDIYETVTHRYVAVGCQNGYLRLSVTHLLSNIVVRDDLFDSDGAMNHEHLYQEDFDSDDKGRKKNFLSHNGTHRRRRIRNSSILF